jgi:EAL domain-containing protein (putative c-di-GMP-specific phosphodiesterase class I)
MVSVSAGLALYTGVGKTAAEALQCARQAVTHAKRAGGGGLATCSGSQMREASGRAELALELSQAIQSGQMRPFYQPVVSLRTDQVLGMEVLARWMHPAHGLLEPSAFIQIAEEQNLCSALTRALLKQTRIDARAWPPHWTFAFNTSPHELPAVLDFIELSERVSGDMIPATRIELEVTETALMQDLGLARRAVAALQPFGVKVVLDDFGSGYANFNQLCQVPFSRLKIDKSLVTHMLADTRVQACTQAIIDLAHLLGMTATAEGVEDAAVAKRLADMGCDSAQGFYFGRPMAAHALSARADKPFGTDGDFGRAA